MVQGIETLRAINDRAAAGPTPGSADAKFCEWAIVDVMGHQRYIGRVTEQVIAGCGFVRVDVPNEDGSMNFSKLIGTGSIYAITPIDEAMALAMVGQSNQAPLSRYELRQLVKPSKALMTRDPDEDYDDCFDDHHEDGDEPY